MSEPVAVGASPEDVRGAVYTICKDRGWCVHMPYPSVLYIRTHEHSRCEVAVHLIVVGGGSFWAWSVEPTLPETSGDDAMTLLKADWPDTVRAARHLREHLGTMSLADWVQISETAWARVTRVLRQVQPLLLEYQEPVVMESIRSIIEHAEV